MLIGQTLDEALIAARECEGRRKKQGLSQTCALRPLTGRTLVEVVSRRALRAAHSWAEKGGRG